MIGLALQGGGARGSYQIGAYYALKKKRIHIDGVCGTSIGAFNGALIACGKEKELLDFWLNVSVAQLLDLNQEYIEKKQKKEYDFTFLKLSIQNIIQIIKTRGVKTDGLEQVLNDYLEDDTLLKSKMDFGICTVRLKDFKPCYIFKEDMVADKIKDYILASCYLPIFKMQKKVDDHYYLDGGFYDNTPINMLIDKGYKKIYVVELNPLLNINRKPKKEVKIIKITPKRSLGGVLTCNKESTIENIKMGYYDALRVLNKWDGYNYCFKRRSNFFYNFLARKIPPKSKKRVMAFLNVKTNKEVVVKAMEYVMKKEGIDYYDIYRPYTMLKKLQKMPKKNHFIYEFLYEVRFF